MPQIHKLFKIIFQVTDVLYGSMRKYFVAYLVQELTLALAAKRVIFFLAIATSLPFPWLTSPSRPGAVQVGDIW